jgi:hypothetical protein
MKHCVQPNNVFEGDPLAIKISLHGYIIHDLLLAPQVWHVHQVCIVRLFRPQFIHKLINSRRCKPRHDVVLQVVVVSFDASTPCT